MMAVPRYRQVVERSKCSEGLSYLALIEGAQERHNARTGEYARRISDLDIKITPPKYYRVGKFSSYDWQTLWQLRLIRSGASSGYGDYSLTWNQNGFYGAASTVDAALIPAGLTSGSAKKRSEKSSGSKAKSGRSAKGEKKVKGNDKEQKTKKKAKKPAKGKHRNRHED
jgi:type IV pilus assembly protein PilA